MGFQNILIKNIKIHIPNKLMTKFSINGLNTVGEVLSLSNIEFSNFKGVGVGLVKLFDNLKIFLNSNESLLNETNLKNTKILVIPKSEFTEDNTFIEIFRNFVNDYVLLLSNEKHKIILTHFYGLNGVEFLSSKDLAIHLGCSNERIRQLRIQIIEDLGSFIFNDNLGKIKVNDAFKLKANEILSKLKSLQLFSLKHFLIEIGDNTSSNLLLPSDEIRLILDVFELTLLGKVETTFTEGTLIISDKKLKSVVLKIAKSAIEKLKDNIIYISESKLLIELKKLNRLYENKILLRVLESLPEVKSIFINNSKCYQIKFQFLSRAADCAYRVLFENNEKMYIDDISSEINHRFASLGLVRKYNRNSLTLVSDKRFTPIAKTGYWALRQWNLNSLSIKDMVIDTMHKFNKPLSTIQISNILIEKRPLLNKNSIRAIIGSYLIKVEGNLWILPEWSKRFSYLELIIRKKKLNNRTPQYRIEQIEAIKDYLNKKSENKDYAPSIISALKSKSKKYTKQSFYNLFKLENYFSKEFEGSKLIVCLKKSSQLVDNKPINSVELGESQNREFKSTLRVNLHTNSPDKKMEVACIKTIAAFLNTSGGILFIGVADDRSILGLEKDFESFKKPDKLDEFQKHLDNLIQNYFDNSFFSLIDIKFPTLGKKMVCTIDVKQSDKPVLLNNEETDFYIRRLGSTVKLNKREMMEYVKNKWY
jgi:hypothetical protein